MNILSIALLAGTIADATPPAEPDACAMLGQIAEIIMEMRQDNAPMSELIAGMVTPAIGDDQDIVRDIIIQAYDQPLWGSDEYKDRAIGEYRNEWEHACYEARS